MIHTPTALHDVAALRAREYAWMANDPSIFLNAASVGPMPSSAVDVANTWSQMRAQPHLLPFHWMLDAASTARSQFAALVGADPDEIALMPNTTYGLNLAARALPLRPGTILTFDGEFPSCVYPFQALGSRGINLELIPRAQGLPDEDALIAAIERPDVVAVVVSWVQFATGYVADLARIGAACRARPSTRAASRPTSPRTPASTPAPRPSGLTTGRPSSTASRPARRTRRPARSSRRCGATAAGR